MLDHRAGLGVLFGRIGLPELAELHLAGVRIDDAPLGNSISICRP